MCNSLRVLVLHSDEASNWIRNEQHRTERLAKLCKFCRVGEQIESTLIPNDVQVASQSLPFIGAQWSRSIESRDYRVGMVTGNSFAAPHIAGYAARIRAAHPGITPFEVKSILAATADNGT